MAVYVMGSARVRPAKFVILALGLAVAGCAGGGSGNGDPGAKSLPAGQTCQSIKVELDRMVNSGVQSSVEAQASGRKISDRQKADADRYNQLLAQYLGARCHAI